MVIETYCFSISYNMTLVPLDIYTQTSECTISPGWNQMPYLDLFLFQVRFIDIDTYVCSSHIRLKIKCFFIVHPQYCKSFCININNNLTSYFFKPSLKIPQDEMLKTNFECYNNRLNQNLYPNLWFIKFKKGIHSWSLG